MDSRLPSPEITAAQGWGEGCEARLVRSDAAAYLSLAAHGCLQIAISYCYSDISFLIGVLAKHPWDGQDKAGPGGQSGSVAPCARDLPSRG